MMANSPYMQSIIIIPALSVDMHVNIHKHTKKSMSFQNESMAVRHEVMLKAGLHQTPSCSVRPLHGQQLGGVRHFGRMRQAVRCAEGLAVFLQRPHFLPSKGRQMSRVAAEEGSPLPVVGPHLQQCLFEGPRGQRVQDGVESAVDGQNKDDDP